MKVTALIPDQLIESAKKYSHAKTTTECLIYILEEWVNKQKLLELHQKVTQSPLQFDNSFNTKKIRTLRHS